MFVPLIGLLIGAILSLIQGVIVLSLDPTAKLNVPSAFGFIVGAIGSTVIFAAFAGPLDCDLQGGIILFFVSATGGRLCAFIADEVTSTLEGSRGTNGSIES